MTLDPHDDIRSLRAEVARLEAENQRLSELLDIAQEFGRLGVWERDPNTLEGRWDRHVFRFFGFEDDATPHFSEAAARVHPDDRLDQLFRASLARPGQHSHRYRVLRPDGTVTHMHSQWRVIAGADGRAARVIGVMVDDTEVHTLAAGAATTQTQLGLALSLSGIGLWRYDLADGRMHYDLRAQEILARPMGPEGVPIETVRSWIHPDDLADVRQAYDETLARGAPTDTHTRYRHANGQWRTILTRRVLLRDAAGRPLSLIGVGVDVTEQQEQNLEALRLAKRLESAAEAAHVGLWSGAVDELPEWNELMYTLLSREPAAGPMSLGDLLRQYAHPQDRDRVARAALAWVRGPVDAALDAVLRIVRPQGDVRWVEVRSRQEVDAAGARRAFGVLLDITEQREALEAAREAEQRSALAMSSVGMGTWSHDVRTGVDIWDEQMFRLRGLPYAVQAPSVEERMALVLPEDRAKVEAVSMPFLATDIPLAYEFRIRRADGEVRTLAARSVALADAQGRIERRIGVNWDVTEARQAENAWREREGAVRESRTKSALFSRVSHELRTPLNAVLGFTQLLLTEGGGGPPEQRRRWLEQIHAAGESLLALVNGVLELNALADQAEATESSPVQLAQALESALANAAPAGMARGIRWQSEACRLVVLGNADRLTQVLARLLAYAAQRSDRGDEVRVACRAAGRVAVVAISDHGASISPPQAGRLFEAFGNASGATSDAPLALGLALAQAQAASMGGQIALARSDASGTTIELRLTLADARAEAAVSESSLARVLYIEDNAVNMLIVRELLAQRPGIEFHGAADGRQGLALAAELKPDLVLIDMQLPDMDGMEVLRRLRSQPGTAALSCVALSANAMPEDVQRARAAGFTDYWTKPIDLSAFLREIDRRMPTA